MYVCYGSHWVALANILNFLVTAATPLYFRFEHQRCSSRSARRFVRHCEASKGRPCSDDHPGRSNGIFQHICVGSSLTVQSGTLMSTTYDTTLFLSTAFIFWFPTPMVRIISALSSCQVWWRLRQNYVDYCRKIPTAWIPMATRRGNRRTLQHSSGGLELRAVTIIAIYSWQIKS